MRDEDRPDGVAVRHDILRDVAYEALAKRERQRLHLRVAEQARRARDGGRFPGTWRSTSSRPLGRRWTSTRGTERSPSARSRRSRTPATSRAGGSSRGRPSTCTNARSSLAGPEDGWGEREAWILPADGRIPILAGRVSRPRRPHRGAAIGVGEDSVRVLRMPPVPGRHRADIRGPSRSGRSELSTQALGAARRAASPWSLARTLLMAGWAPYWRTTSTGARAMFEEALAIARARRPRCRWAEARALVGLARRDLAGRRRGGGPAPRATGPRGRPRRRQPFTTAVARETVSGVAAPDDAARRGA